jgi:hypothetical protein
MAQRLNPLWVLVSTSRMWKLALLPRRQVMRGLKIGFRYFAVTGTAGVVANVTIARHWLFLCIPRICLQRRKILRRSWR